MSATDAVARSASTRLRLMRPLSPTDDHPARARSSATRAAAGSPTSVLAAAGEPVISCMHSRQDAWMSQGVSSSANGGGSLLSASYPTLPLCAQLYSDKQGHALLPFACAVNADSFRRTMMLTAKRSEQEQQAAQRAEEKAAAAPYMADSYASEESTQLKAADLSLLADALLCNSHLTSLSLDRAALDSHALNPLCTLLQQHSSLTSVSLSGNLLGLHPDAEQLRHLFHVLASPATLPFLSTLNLAHNQFPPRSLEIFCAAFLRTAPSIQSIDWRENEVGLRGGWAVVDALRVRSEARKTGPEGSSVPALALVTSFQLECDELDDHDTAAHVSSGALPQPNLSQVRSITRARPAYAARVQQLLKDNREQADLQMLREEQAQKLRAQKEEQTKQEHEEDESKGVRFSTRASSSPEPPSSTTGAAAAASSAGDQIDGFLSRDAPPSLHDPVPPSFLSPALFHASLGRMVSELNLERATRFEHAQQLAAAREREKELEEQIESQRLALRDAAEQFDIQSKQLLRETAHRKELEAALLAMKTKEAALVASHARQVASLNRRADDALSDAERLRGQLTRARSDAEEQRMAHMKEVRTTAKIAAAREANEGAHSAALRELERRVEQLQWERTHLQVTGSSYKSPATAAAQAAAIGKVRAAPFASGTISSSVEKKASSTGGSNNSTNTTAAPSTSSSIHPGGGLSSSSSGGLSVAFAPLGAPARNSPSSSTRVLAPIAVQASASNSPPLASRTPLSITVWRPEDAVGASSSALSASASASGESAMFEPVSPLSASAAARSVAGSPELGTPTGLSPSVTMFASGAPPLPPNVLSPTHSMQLMPHHIPTWQQPAPKPITLKLKPKQRGQ